MIYIYKRKNNIVPNKRHLWYVGTACPWNSQAWPTFRHQFFLSSGGLWVSTLDDCPLKTSIDRGFLGTFWVKIWIWLFILMSLLDISIEFYRYYIPLQFGGAFQWVSSMKCWMSATKVSHGVRTWVVNFELMNIGFHIDSKRMRKRNLNGACVLAGKQSVSEFLLWLLKHQES